MVSNTLFMCSIISIFCVLLATVPMNYCNDDDDDNLGEDSGIREAEEEYQVDPVTFAQKNKTSFYNYLKSIENVPIGPEYRTVEFWMEARNKS